MTLFIWSPATLDCIGYFLRNYWDNGLYYWMFERFDALELGLMRTRELGGIDLMLTFGILLMRVNPGWLEEGLRGDGWLRWGTNTIGSLVIELLCESRGTLTALIIEDSMGLLKWLILVVLHLSRELLREVFVQYLKRLDR